MTKKEEKNLKKDQEEEEKAGELLDIFAQSRLAIFTQATMTTVIITAIFGGGGYFLDQQFGTFPGLFITGIIVAFPTTQIYLFKKFKKYAKDKANKSK